MFDRIFRAHPQTFWNEARKVFFLDWIFRLSTIPVIGRAQRKALFIVIRLLDRALHAVHWAYARLPFIVATSLADYTDMDYFTRKNSPGTLFLKYLNHLTFITARFQQQPKFSIILPIYKVHPKYLREAINSVCYQVYTNWELCVVDDCSKSPEIDTVIAEYADKLGESKFKFRKHESNLHISQTSNDAASMATGDYLIFLDHDDRLTPNALAEVVRFININDAPDILYSDERTVGENGEHKFSTFYKPDFSKNFLYSVNYICHLLVMRRELFTSIGGFRVGFEGAQDHDLVLRATEQTSQPIVHIPMCLYEWRAIPQSTASGIGAKSYALQAGVKAVSDAIGRAGKAARVSVDANTNHYKVQYIPPEQLPLISILVPSKDAFETLKNCLDSIFTKTTWTNFEVLLLDNDTTDPNALQLIEEYKSNYSNKFRVINCPGPFNFNGFNNEGAKAANGDFLVLLNNDTEVITPNWLEELWGLAHLPDSGAIGAKLLYEDGTLQHAGVLLFGKRIAGHSCAKLEDSNRKYCAISATTHEASAVTAACMMIRKDKFFEVDGLDDLVIPNGWGDVDFCLRLRQRGYKNIYTPYAELYHYESKSRGLSFERFEMLEMIKRHGEALIRDPYLNPNLNLDGNYDADPVYSGSDPDALVMKALLRKQDDFLEKRP